MEPHRHSLKVTFTEHHPIFIKISMNHVPDFSKLLFSSYVFSGNPMRIEKLLFRLTCNFIRPSKNVQILFSPMKSKLLTHRLWIEQFIWDVSFLDFMQRISLWIKLWLLLSKCVGAMIYQKKFNFQLELLATRILWGIWMKLKINQKSWLVLSELIALIKSHHSKWSAKKSKINK